MKAVRERNDERRARMLLAPSHIGKVSVDPKRDLWLLLKYANQKPYGYRPGKLEAREERRKTRVRSQNRKYYVKNRERILVKQREYYRKAVIANPSLGKKLLAELQTLQEQLEKANQMVTKI